MIQKETACKGQKRAFQTSNTKHMKTLRWKELSMFDHFKYGHYNDIKTHIQQKKTSKLRLERQGIFKLSMALNKVPMRLTFTWETEGHY